MGHGVKGIIVAVSHGIVDNHRFGRAGKLLVDAGSEGLFLFTAPRLPELPPRVLIALSLSQKCLT